MPEDLPVGPSRPSEAGQGRLCLFPCVFVYSSSLTQHTLPECLLGGYRGFIIYTFMVSLMGPGAQASGIKQGQLLPTENGKCCPLGVGKRTREGASCAQEVGLGCSPLWDLLHTLSCRTPSHLLVSLVFSAATHYFVFKNPHLRLLL